MRKPVDIGEMAIMLDGVSVSYKSKSRFIGKSAPDSRVLDNVSLTIRHGDSLGVIGGNGAGKSTILRLLGGLIDPDSGRIEKHVETVSLLSIQVGFVPYLSGRNNAVLSGLLTGASRQSMEQELEGIKEFSGLGKYFEQPVNTYSAGMRSRLGFATSINIDPDVLLIDEILAVGDAEFKKKSQSMIQEKIDADKTIVLVSHSTELIRKCCNRVVWVEQGKIIKDGDVEDIVSEYEKKYAVQKAC